MNASFVLSALVFVAGWLLRHVTLTSPSTPAAQPSPPLVVPTTGLSGGLGAFLAAEFMQQLELYAKAHVGGVVANVVAAMHNSGQPAPTPAAKP